MSKALNIKMKSRAQLVQCSDVLARTIDPKFLHDDQESLIVSVFSNQPASAKTVVVEAMMKSFADNYSAADMVLPDAKKSMFLETEPNDALLKSLFCKVNSAAKKTFMGFTHTSSFDHKNVQRVLNDFHCARDGGGGVLFFTSSDPLSAYYGAGIQVELINLDSEQGGNPWNKEMVITIKNEDILACPQF
jgi:hypothetical protein